MSSKSVINCWEIIECEEAELCKAREFPDTPCWKIDQMFNSCRAVADVCSECKVYLINTNDPVFMAGEQMVARENLEIMRFVKKCPAYSNTLTNDDCAPL